MQTVMNKKCTHSAINGVTIQKTPGYKMLNCYTTHTFPTFFILSMYRILYTFVPG